MITKSTDNAFSRYVWGGSTEVYDTRLGWWERYYLGTSDSDSVIVLPPEYDRRPDLLAFDIYGKSTHMSLILQYNNIIDINLEFVTGVTLRIPSGTKVNLDIVNKSTGGVKMDSK